MAVKEAISDTTVSDSARSYKAFRNSSELEKMVRFVHDNGLRREAHMLMSFACLKLKKPKKKTRAKRTKKIQ